MRYNIDKKKVTTIVILVVVIILIYFISLPKNCKTDDSCFDSAAAKCSKAKVTTFSEDNNYYYEILGKKKDKCIIEVKLLELSNAETPEMKQALEGKSMTCSIENSMLQSTSIRVIKNLNDMCTGQLKEATLQITMDKMYEIIVQNIGPIALEFQRGLNQ